ncbi:DUF1254 domain-containing protein [Sulfurovum sp.]|uniref:DUF1254 domain-containing protein n=1 Tax=Sulfurovum sp. TaxID=1969726 RepID=UPI0025E96285|nr:DUF1254 domain-containing protein [Sulfurovum sp.]
MIKIIKRMFTGVLVTLFAASLQLNASSALEKEELDRIALQSYIYTYPLVLMEVTRKQMTNMPLGENPNRGPMMQFTHIRTFPNAKFREVVRPNFDTLYSLAWVDVSKEPVILSVPEVKDRFFMLPMYDMWTDTFAVVGTYANGTKAGNYALCMPEWKGELPKGVERIDATTPMFWIIGRTQTNGPKDYDYIHKIQDGYKLTPLSYFTAGKPFKPVFKKDKSVDDVTPPVKQVEKMDAKTFFTMAMKLMKTNPPHATDQVRLDRMKRIGLTPDGFYYDKLPKEVKAALERATAKSHDVMREYASRLGSIVNGWQILTKSVGVYGIDYLQRATTAFYGLGANPYYWAFYPLNVTDKNGKVPTGDKKYVIHFDKEPPVDAFWSVTIYDKDGFPIDNPMNRYAIGDRDNLKFNADGSVDIYIQNTSPGKEKESNWLPSSAKGVISLVIRMYGPKQVAIDGKWQPPYLEEVK